MRRITKLNHSGAGTAVGRTATDSVRRVIGGAAAAAWASVYHSNAWVGVVAGAQIAGTAAILGVPVDWTIVAVAAAGAVVVYQTERLWWPRPEDTVNHPERTLWRTNHRRLIVGLATVAVVITAVGATRVGPASFLVGVVLGLVGVAYVVPLMPGRRSLRDVWFLKPVCIALTWTAGVVLLPFVSSDGVSATAMCSLAAYRFSVFGVNAVTADAGDVVGDRSAGIRTVATELGQMARARLVIALAVAGSLALASLAAVGVPSLLVAVEAAGGVVLLFVGVGVGERNSVVAADLLMAWPVLTWMVGHVIA